MKSIIKTTAVISIIFSSLFCSTANAALITNNGYTLDTDSHVISNGELEWFQRSETAGLSISQSLQLNPGWRLASDLEVSSLFSTFFADSNWKEDENDQSSEQLTYGENEDPYFNFLTLFGFSAQSFDSSATTFLDHYQAVTALFGNDYDNDGYFPKATVADGFQFIHSGETMSVGAFANLSGDEYDVDYTNVFTGVALVRDRTQVPEPASAILFLLGLILLGAPHANKRSI